jgi:multidrug efflux pump subunit AcrA (membrane-fusion protein)
MNRRQILILGAALTVAVLASTAGSWYLYAARSEPAGATAVASERKVLYWHDPMVPGYRSDKPGKSPFMDMDLVPVYADEAGAEAGTGIAVRPEIAASIGIRTEKAVRMQAVRRIETDGYVFREGGGVRVLADLFDRDADAVRAGLAAEVRVPSAPGRTWKGVVERVEPDIGVGTRSLKATVRVLSPDAALQPNLYAEVTIRSAAPGTRLLVPREALIRTGRRTAVVVAHADGGFQPVDVTAGAEYGDAVEIVNGIKEGDTVVTSGQFLIDSEASVRSSFARMAPSEQ